MKLSNKDWELLQPILCRAYVGAMPSHAYNLRIHAHHLTAWLIQEGEATVLRGANIYTARAGEWIVLPMGERIHRIKEGSIVISLHFNFGLRPEAPVLDIKAPLVFPSIEAPDMKTYALKFARFAAEKLQASPETYLPEIVCSLHDFLYLRSTFCAWVFELVARLEERDLLWVSEGDDLAEKILHGLDQWPLIQSLSMSDFAMTQGFSFRHLSRIFTARFGITPKKYVEIRRLEFARAGVSNPEVMIKVVAGDLGFVHLSQFSNWFSKHEGCSPRAFRKRIVEGL